MQITQNKYFKPLISLNIIILFTLSQLNNVHYDPLPQFWAEATFAWASLSLFMIVCLGFQELCIPKISIPLLIFAIYLAIQPYLVNITFPGLSYVASIEFIICILLAISFSTLLAQYGIKYIVITIALALVIGAILQSIISLLQYTGYYKYFGSLIFFDSAHPTTDIFGHFGQRNHYCHYMAWATFGLIYIYLEEKLNKITFGLLLVWFMSSITIAASRTVFIYFISAIVISLLYFIFNRDKKSFDLFKITIITFIILFIFEYTFPLIQHYLDINSKHIINSGLERIQASSGDLFGRRLIEWKKAWLTFKSYPIFGFGLNEFAHQSVYLEPLFKNTPPNDGLFTNCHNLILQLLAETGLIGTTIIIGGCIWVIYNLIKQNNLEHIIILCMITTTFAHSMLEYPLWYLYFLGPFVVFLSTDKYLFKINSNIVSAIGVIPIAFIVYSLVSGSIIFNTLVYYNNPPDDNIKAFNSQATYLDKLLNHNILWDYTALYCLDNYIIVNDPQTNHFFSQKQQIALESRFANSHPYPEVLIKLAKLYVNSGDIAKANDNVRLAISSFPVYKSKFLKNLKNQRYAAQYKIVKSYNQ